MQSGVQKIHKPLRAGNVPVLIQKTCVSRGSEPPVTSEVEISFVFAAATRKVSEDFWWQTAQHYLNFSVSLMSDLAKLPEKSMQSYSRPYGSSRDFAGV